MALVWIDGFEAYGSANDTVDVQMRRAGYYFARPFSGSTNPKISSFTRRGIGLSLLPNTWSYNGGPQLQIGATAKVIAGLAICIPTPLLGGYDFTPGVQRWGGTTVLAFNSSTLFEDASHHQTYDDQGIGYFYNNGIVNIQEDLSIRYQDHDGFGWVTSPPGVITPGLWQYMECKLDTTAGTVEIRLDGVTVAKGAWTSGVKPINTVCINVAGNAGVGFLAVDDFYVCNGDGDGFNDFLGDCVVHAVYPGDEGYIVNTEAIVGGPSAHAALTANPPGGVSKFITTGASDGDTVLFTPQAFPPDFIDVLAVEVCAQFPQGNIAPLPPAAPSTPVGGTAIIFPLPAMGAGSGGGGGAAGGGVLEPIQVSGAAPTFKTGDAPYSGVTPFDLAIVQNAYSALIGNAAKVNPTPIPGYDGPEYCVARLLLPAMPEGGPWTTDNAQGLQFGVVANTPTAGQIDFSAIYLNCLATYSPDYGFIDVILDDVFPNDISYESVGSTRFATDVIVVDSGADQRVQRWDQPLMEYDVGYGVRTMEQLQAMIAFFRVMRGRKNAFNYLDHVDHTSSVATGYEARRAPPVTAFDQPLATADGVAKTFQLTKTYASQTQTQVRPIYRPIPGSVRVGIRGKEVTNFTVDNQGRVTFSSPLTLNIGHTVTKGDPGNANVPVYTGQPGDFSALLPYVNNGWFIGVSGFANANDNIAASAGAYVTSVSADGSQCNIAFPHGLPYQTTGATTESMALTINAAPPQGAPVTAGFQFYVPVRFDTDTLPITLHEYGVGGANSVKLIEVRPSSW